MSQYGNYTSRSTFSLESDMMNLQKENKRLTNVVFLFSSLFFACYLFLCFINYKQAERLNEHKRLLIAQQTQINQLILNAKKHEITK